MLSRRLVVSVHDVAPSTVQATRRLLAALDGVGARPRVLKVVPNERGRGDVRPGDDLAQLLRAERAAGSEVVLHGYTHQVAGRLRGPWIERVRARLFVPTGAEFLSLDAGEMASRLERGRGALRGVGVEASGFCPPGWVATAEVLPVLRTLGFRYYVGMASVRDLRSGDRVATPWIGYVGAGGIQEVLVGLGNAAAAGASRWSPVIKVFLHPQGAPDAPACRRVLRSLARLVDTRRPVTFGDLLDA